MLNVCAVISRGKMWLFGKSFHSYIELVRIFMSLNLPYLSNMFELFRQTFALRNETFAKKSILSENIFVTLQMIYALYVRVRQTTAQNNRVIWHIH